MLSVSGARQRNNNILGPSRTSFALSSHRSHRSHRSDLSIGGISQRSNFSRCSRAGQRN